MIVDSIDPLRVEPAGGIEEDCQAFVATQAEPAIEGLENRLALFASAVTPKRS